MMTLVLSEYTGLLVGGPKDGLLVTSSVARIPYVSSEELWLDGVGENEDLIPTTERTEGTYIWDDVKGHFEWELKGVGYDTRA